MAIGYLIYRQQKLKNKQQTQEFQLKSAIAAIETQNQLHEQRLSISRDLHDNIGAQLTFIISSVDNLKFGNQISDNRVVNQLTKISDFTKSTIIELRDTIWAMNTNEFTFEDLRSRIFNFIEKAKSAKENINFKFVVDENIKEKNFSSIIGINLYRVMQEAVNNALKYSDATQIEVHVSNQNNQTKIEIIDNGKGFDMKTVDLGNGIHNMRKRIEDVDGMFDIISKPNQGTQIIILIE
jgi:signal transduction histidine kinase